MLLTDEEIIYLFPDTDDGDGDIQYGRAIESAVLAKLWEQESVAWMYQHEDTGLVGFIEQYQLDNRFEKLNPRLQVTRPLFEHPAPIPEGWQPIETAPKDGSRVLIKGDCTVVAGWQEITGMHGHMGWAIVNDAWMPSSEARYWMPLPKLLMAAARSKS